MRVFGFPHSVRLTASAKVTGMLRAPKEQGFGLLESAKSGEAGEAGISPAFCARADPLTISRHSSIENDRRSMNFFQCRRMQARRQIEQAHCMRTAAARVDLGFRLAA
jgi:hypothetical protein